MRLLHLLSQRPGRSGSGVFLGAMVEQAARRGIRQHAVAVGPPGTDHRELPPLGRDELTPIVFPNELAPFPAPGNSDVMPYPSSVFSQMDARQIDRYLAACRRVLEEVRDRFRPDLVHAHHLWLMTALAREVFADTPVIATSHNAELRQMVRAPWLAPRVVPGIRALDQVCVLTPRSLVDTVEAYGVDEERLRITGAGYRPELFHPSDEPRHPSDEPRHPSDEPRLPLVVTFIGRLSSAKGLPHLLAAVERVRAPEPWRLQLVGASGSGEDGARMDRLVERAGERVIHLGAVPHEQVGPILRASSAFVLPSLFEGLPLVMLEAAACGCPCLVSALPPLDSWVGEEWRASGAFRTVPPLATVEADRPVAADVPRYVADLARGLETLLNDPPPRHERGRLAELASEHTWSAVFDRYLRVYGELVGDDHRFVRSAHPARAALREGGGEPFIDRRGIDSP